MNSQESGISAIGQISLMVRDAERATVFYRDVLGLPHLYTFGDLVFFDCAGTRLYLHRVPDEQWRAGSVIYFAVADITAAYRELANRGAVFVEAPHLVHRHESGVEEWMAFLEDGEGNTLALISPVDPSQQPEAPAL